MSDSIFSKLEQECALEREIIILKEKISLLEQENAILKQTELDRTKFNMDAECACIYTNSTGACVYGEKEQLDKLIFNSEGLKFTRTKVQWGDLIQFNSVASARTCLLRNGYKYTYTSQSYYKDSCALHLENWIRGI
jgi:hypothetical protein